MMVKKTCRNRLTAFISTAKRNNHASPDILAVLSWRKAMCDLVRCVSRSLGMSWWAFATVMLSRQLSRFEGPEPEELLSCGLQQETARVLWRQRLQFAISVLEHGAVGRSVGRSGCCRGCRDGER